MKKGSSFEDYIHYVYSIILILKGEKVQVSKRTVFKIPPDETYEIDIFYEFINAGVMHRVAIECKDWKTPVDQGKVLEFHQKIKNIGEDIIGVFVSRSGYQSGAKKVAKRHGILTLSSDEIPTIFDLLSKQITKFFLPSEDDIGEPFWTLMELDDDEKITGSYYSPQKDNNGNSVILLMFSKKQANEVMEFRKINKDKYAVRGLRQYHLKGMLLFLEKQNVTFALMPPFVPKNTPEGAVFLKNAEEIRNEFLL